MRAPRLETRVRAYWQAASSMRRGAGVTRIVAARALYQLALGEHAGLSRRAVAILNSPAGGLFPARGAGGGGDAA